MGAGAISCSVHPTNCPRGRQPHQQQNQTGSSAHTEPDCQINKHGHDVPSATKQEFSWLLQNYSSASKRMRRCLERQCRAPWKWRSSFHVRLRPRRSVQPPSLPPSLNVALRCTESFSRPPSNSLDQNLKFRAPQSRLMYKTTHDYNTRGCSK